MLTPMMTICRCGRPAHHRHHKFPQHKTHRRKYKKLLDKSFNIEMMCAECHTSHMEIDKLWDEEEFIAALTEYIDELEQYRQVFK